MTSSFSMPKRLLIVSLVLVAVAIQLAGQNSPSAATQHPTMDQYDPTSRALAMTREEYEAESQVSFSAETILATLHNQPGLVLEIKRLLVRKSYEQGRLLDPADLTDEKLFELIREDHTIRVLATREIEDRLYVKVKPGSRERELELAPSNNTQTGGQRSPAPNLYSAAPTVQPSNPPIPNAPQQSPIPLRNPARELNRASTQPATTPYSGSPDQLRRISPDELPSVLAGADLTGASFSSRTNGQLGMDNTHGAMDMGVPSGLGNGIPPGLSLPDMDTLQQLAASPQQQASLESPVRPQIPSPLYSGIQANTTIRRRPNPYADVPSLYDIYSQVSQRQPVLQRFGADIFTGGTGNVDELPTDLPVGPDYVVGPGDGLNIDLWGPVSERLTRNVDREGRISLPEIGTVLVAGKTLGEVQQGVEAALRSQFRNIQDDVSLSRIRTIRVYVVGDVLRPGAYDISALSTPLNALFAAGGPTDRGSLRLIKHYRGKQLVQDVDVYDLILHGIRSDIQGIQSGDTILIPPIGPQITVEGMVRRPAKYELRDENNLAEALELAGGVLSTGTLRHIDVERVQAHVKRTMLTLDIPEVNDQQKTEEALVNFKIQDGDVIQISPILPYSDKTVYLDGHVFHPGKYPYQTGMKITDLVKSYKDLLPEPYERHAEVIRLTPPTFRPTVISFNLADAMKGGSQDLTLKPFDTVRVFGRFDFEDPPVVSVVGEVRDPGDHLTNGATSLRDAIYLAGGLKPDALLNDVQVYRHFDGGKLKVLSADLGKALAGDPANNLLLEPLDRVIVHRNLARLDPPSVDIEGEVARPGKYPLGANMSAADLVRLAGGFKRGAYTDTADLSRYVLENGQKVVGEHQEVPVARALAGEPDADVRLRDGDVLTIRQLTGWHDVGAMVEVKGEVGHTGKYGIQDGERLSSVLQRAGGFRESAYPYGAILLRKSVRDLEERNQSDLISRVQAVRMNVAAMPESSPNDKLAKDAAMQQWQSTLERLENTPPDGRVVLHISKNLRSWENTANDIEVRSGDVLIIPKRPDSVAVFGQVYNPTAVSYRPGKSAKWYLSQAGGATQLAEKKAIFVVRADGSVVGSGSSSWWSGSPLGTVLRPGDSIFVPEKAAAGPRNWTPLLQTAQIASSLSMSIIYMLR